MDTALALGGHWELRREQSRPQDNVPRTSEANRIASDGAAQLERLLAAAGRGDRQAFADLYRLTAPRLFAVARRFVPQHQRAEEILQECYLTVWHNASRYDAARAAPMTWLIAIVRNRCFDALRVPVREFSPEHEDDSDPLERFASTEPGPMERFATLQDQQRVHEALARLPDHYRHALTLAYAHECAHAELAARLQVPLGTAKSWVRRGLEALRSDLALRKHRR